MPFEISHDTNNHMIFGKFSGVIKLEILREYVVEMKKFCNPGSIQRIMTDYREAQINLSTLELFQLPERHDRLLMSMGFNVHRIKRAILYDPQDSASATFFETVALNRGHMVKIFTDENKAREWLMD